MNDLLFELVEQARNNSLYHAVVNNNEIIESYSIASPNKASCINDENELVGTKKNDVITGSIDDNYANGRGGNDLIIGGFGDDILFGKKVEIT